MDMLELIKNRKTRRRYQNKDISDRSIGKILEAGRWGPSLLLGFQPWKFVVIRNKLIIKALSQLMLNKSYKIGAGGNMLLRLSANTIVNANILIVVYNTQPVEKALRRFKERFIKLGRITEISSISAAIQNMMLVAETLGIGSCWHDSPLLCKKEINRLLNVKEELFAILTFGYPAEKGKRAKRKPLSDSIEYRY